MNAIKAVAWFIVGMLFYTVVSAPIVLVCFVAWHFIHKYW